MKIKKSGWEALERPFECKIDLVLKTSNGDLILEVEPLPLGFLDEIEKRIPTPKPPKKGWLRGKKNRFLKDENGQMIPEVDEEDPKYLEEKEIADKRQNIAIVWKIISSSHEIEFQAEDDDTPEFFDRIHTELLEAGLNSNQLKDIFQTIREKAGLDEEELAIAKKN